jgi:inhibitor of cysteine peptidase
MNDTSWQTNPLAPSTAGDCATTGDYRKPLAAGQVLVALALLCLLCFADVAAAPPAQQPGEVRLSMQQDGSSVDLKEGQLLTVSLESNPSTHYIWQVAEINRAMLRQVGGTEYLPSTSRSARAGDRSRLGAPQTALLRFEAVTAGESTLRLVYRRPWEKDRPPARNFSVRARGVGTFGEVKPLPTPTPAPTVDPRIIADTGAQLGLPAHFNWCEQGGCTPVKDQGECGSCWAFSTVGTMESAIRLKDSLVKDLSEQYLVSCNTDGWSCEEGGEWAHDYHWWKIPPGEAAAGARYEADFPYQAADVPCNPPHPAHERIIGWAFVQSGGGVPSVAAIKQAIYDHGPVSAAVCAGDAYDSYTGGIFSTNEGCGAEGTNHAIVLVGWDNSEGGYWYLRDSAGAGFGESGYMRIKWGTSLVGEEANYITYFSVKQQTYLPVIIRK